MMLRLWLDDVKKDENGAGGGYRRLRHLVLL